MDARVLENDSDLLSASSIFCAARLPGQQRDYFQGVFVPVYLMIVRFLGSLKLFLIYFQDVQADQLSSHEAVAKRLRPKVMRRNERGIRAECLPRFLCDQGSFF